mgnify:FL=1
MTGLDSLITDALAAPATLDTPLPATPLHAVPGVSVGVANGSVKKPGRTQPDVVVVATDAPASFAAVTTTSTAAAAACLWTRARVPALRRAVVVNSGNANAATGRQGVQDNLAMAAAVAEQLGCVPDDVLVCSTGVIGVPLPMERLAPAVTVAAHDAAHRVPPASSPARAICTTDTRTKGAGVTVGGVTVAGMAKGSGMIHPNMATMLGFIATDAKVAPDHLQALLEAVADRTFHQISVDGDMSTNDTVVLLASGVGPWVEPGGPGWSDLVTGVSLVARQLAREIARDGEGARTLLTVTVEGGPDDAAARAWSRAVVSSSLFKAAVHGKDPNWGRIVGALGAAGAIGLDALDVDLGGVAVMREGAPVPFDEPTASAAMAEPELCVTLRLPGDGHGVAWGCDLSAEYVSINADYRS